MKPIQADEVLSDLPFPLHGIDRSLGFSSQPGGTTPTGQNVRAHEPRSARAKGGSRPGLSRFIDSSLGGPVQLLAAIASSDEAGSYARSLPVGDASSPPTGYTDDPSSAGDMSSWGQGDGKDWGADGTPGEGGQGGNSAGGGGLGRLTRTPPNRIRTGGSGIPPGKNSLPSITPAITWPAVPEVSVIDTVTHPDDSAETWPEPVARDPSGNIIPGEWTYTPAEGTTLTPGDHTVTGIFKPTDPAFGVKDATTTVRAEYMIPRDSTKKTGTGPNIISDPITSKAGELLVAVVVTQTASTPILQDNQENVWTQAGSTVTSGVLKLSLWYAIARAGSHQLTVHGDAADAYIGVCVGLYRGNHQSSVLHATASDTGTNDAPGAGTVSLNASGDLIVLGACGATAAAGAVSLNDATYTIRQETFSSAAGPKIGLADNSEATSGAAVKWLLAGAMAWGAIAASFKKA